MNIFFIRHGNPNYDTDCLTPLGHEQAEACAERMLNQEIKIDDAYSSPYGRAKETCEHFTKKANIDYTVLPWLHEVEHYADVYGGHFSHAVSIDPAFLRDPEIEAMGDKMFTHPRFGGEENIKKMVGEVYDGLDALLKEYGYEKEGHRFKVTDREKCDKNVAIYAHAGTFLLVLGYLLQMPDTWAWHSFFTYQTGVTWINLPTDRDYAVPRMYYMGDTSHLVKKGIAVT